MKRSEVYWRIQLARKRLKLLDIYEKKKVGPSFIGVRRESRRYTAAIRKDGFYRHLGSFATAEEAAEAYDKAAIEIHGNEAKLNFPPRRKSA